MRPRSEVSSPRVFLSFAGKDRTTAQLFRAGLTARNIAVYEFPPGVNLVLEISRKLEQSDYFVLLWSQSCVDHAWVGAEWSAALARELRERRSFLFVVRLDGTPLPALLAARHYLDARGNDPDTLMHELATIWQQDRWVQQVVLPAPFPAPRNGKYEGRSIELYICNRAFSVAHLIAVPVDSTGCDLQRRVRDELALPDDVQEFGGAVGMRFYYQLRNVLGTISGDPRQLAELRVADGDVIDLLVQVETFGPDGKSSVVTYRDGGSTNLSEDTTRYLINSAFGHLIPW
jgi:hypothetical protein